MGLDMFLFGKVSCLKSTDKVDDFPVVSKEVKLGYWRKHPNLHGFIVNTFADGVDDCKAIHLTEKNLRTILKAVNEDQLPHTEGFFFGTSLPEYKEETIDILKKAIEFLEKKNSSGYRSVYYRASW